MLRVSPLRQVLPLLLAVLLTLSVGQATVASEVMSLQMAKLSMTANTSATNCQDIAPKPCESMGASCVLMCAAPILGMPVVAAFGYDPHQLQARSAGTLPAPMGMTGRPNLPPPRSIEI